jgi:GH24 family phage-related lysozyme (muramidase)
MLTATEKQILRTGLEKYEGKVNHMYLDSKGYVTVGVGHLINSVEAQKLAFKTAKNLPASAPDIKADYDAVKKQPANRLASFYKKYTKLILLNSEIDKLTNKHIDSFEKELRLIYSGFDAFPSEVKLALFDLIFNLGMTNLKGQWPMFNTAIKVKDWQKAADNSNRTTPISAERNKYVKDLLEKAAKTAQSGQPKNLKP